MNMPETHLHRQIDALTHTDASFALYRLPWKEQPVLVLQPEGVPDTYAHLQDLNGKTGFIFAPFHAESQQPIVLIRPDKVARGWPEIKKVLTGLQCFAKLKPSPNQASGSAKDSRQAYAEAFGRFIAPLRQGTFRKLVLSRSEDIRLPEDFSPLATFLNACQRYPRLMISLVHTPLTGTWIGSTPEIILSEEQGRWHTVSLAGTLPVVNGGRTEEWGTKNREEQALVSTYLRETLQQMGTDLQEEGPYTARAGQVMHLKTDFYFRRHPLPAPPHPRRMRPAQSRSLRLYPTKRRPQSQLLCRHHRLAGAQRRTNRPLRQPALHAPDGRQSHALRRRRHPPLFGGSIGVGGNAA